MSSPEKIIIDQRAETIKELGIQVGNTVKLRNGVRGKITQIDLSYRTGYPIVVRDIGTYTLAGTLSVYTDGESPTDIVDWNYKDKDGSSTEDINNNNTTGFIKHDNGKPLISLIDPKFIEGLATVMTQGANKYGRDNWKECKEPHRYLDALLRHTLKYWDGEKVDTESGKSHLYHIAFNAMALHYLDKN